MLERVTWRAWSWIVPGALAVLAFVLRVIRLDRPPVLAFDETYYAKDAWSLRRFGYVREYVEDANERIERGDLDALFGAQPSWIVHPDGGKWFIALGESVFGMTPFGWRIGAVVAGSLTVLVLARLLIALTDSLWVGALGGLLLTLDGMHFVMSRLALLDVFLTLWLVCAVACLVTDGRRLEEALAAGLRRPRRSWQFLAGLCFGLAVSTKWSGLYVLAAFGVAVVLWEVAARRRWAATRGDDPVPLVPSVLRTGLPAFCRLVVVAGVVYLLSWAGWFWHRDRYEARFGHGYGEYAPWPSVEHPIGGAVGAVLDPLRSWWSFHLMTWDFHTGDYLAEKSHPYASHPIGWLVQWRPVAVHTATDLPADRCGAAPDSSCISEVLILGNPLIWWVGVLALIAVLVLWLRRRSWRLSLPLVGVAATWLPWFANADRPIFSFYSVAIAPFLIIAVCLAAHGVQRRLAARGRSRLFWAALGLYLLAVVAAFVFFYPIWTDVLLPYETWRQRMWLPRWI